MQKRTSIKHIKHSAQNTILEAIYLGIRMIVLLLATRIIVQRFGIAGFGYYSFWFAVSTYLAVIVDFGVNLTGVREVGKHIAHNTDPSQTYYAGILVRILPALVLFCLSIILLALKIILLKEFWVLLSIIFMGVFESTWFMQAFDEYTLRTIFNIAVRILFLLCVIYLPISWGVLAILLVRNLAILIKDAIAFLIIEIKYKLRKLPNKQELKNFAKLSLHNYITLIFSAGYRQTYPLLLKFFVSDYVYGIFSAVYRMLSLAGETQLIITRPAFTLFSRKIKDYQFYKKGVYITTLIIFVFGVIILGIAYSPIVIKIIYPGLEYHGLFFYMMIGAYLTGILWSLTGHTNVVFMVLKHKDKILSKVMISKLLITLIGLFSLQALHIVAFQHMSSIQATLLFLPLWAAELVNLCTNIKTWQAINYD